MTDHKLRYYVDIAFHDTAEEAGYTIGGFDIDANMTDEQIGAQVRTAIEDMEAQQQVSDGTDT